MHRENSFDTVRLIAAGLVLFSHTQLMLGLPVYEVPILEMELAHFGVWIFFIMSGYLITGSIQTGVSLIYFFSSRALRIYPGLVVALIFCILLGAVETALPPATYFSEKSVWRFLWGNVFPFFQDQPITINGVFEGSPWKIVNGSLWTIKYEMLCYLIFAPFCLLGIGRNLALLIFVSVLLSTSFYFVDLIPSHDITFTRIQLPLVVSFLFYFGLGASFAVLKTFSWFAWPAISMALLASAMAFLGTPLESLLSYGFIAAILLWLGESRLLYVKQYRRLGDLSYGLYLYAFPISTLVVTYLATLPPLAIHLVAAAVALIAACMSWRFVEAPAMLLKGQISRGSNSTLSPEPWPAASSRDGRGARQLPRVPAIHSATTSGP